MVAEPPTGPCLEATVVLPGPVDLALTLGHLQRGRGDPTTRVQRSEAWRATRTPAGPASLHLAARAGEIRARAWGPGAGWALEHAPALLGAKDDRSSFLPRHPLLVTLDRLLAGLRIGRTDAVLEAAFPAVLEQKVTGLEARRSFALLVRQLGMPAPGPGGLLLPPDAAALSRTPSWVHRRAGVEGRRGETIRRCAGAASRLEEAARLPREQALLRLTAIPGVGAWTAATIAATAFGDPDAVPLGDDNLPHTVAWALAREPRATDARMLELLEPYRGHRGRVLRLLAAAGIRAPRFGPRMPLRDIARLR